MSHAAEFFEGDLSGENVALTCSTCGREYFSVAIPTSAPIMTVELPYPVAPCHAGISLNCPVRDPLVDVKRLLGVSERKGKFRGTVRMLNGMIYGFDVQVVL